ncbi:MULTISPECIES: AMP-binding protein [unclassified Janthinobacterium]|uniref:AMP-binding protein n=1 Tax=unclassified Janthinobacterium TaxID=2610881 RepID=UPI0018C92DF5|nr:AMP-binding protein [Janthinobacterium sp. CG_23.4]MDH6156887.1 2-aminobenzoate-CoA ligase [Janthinobacterium sp. CG_23.4]
MSSDPTPSMASPQDDFARAHLPPRALWPQLCLDLPELQYRARLNCVTELLDAAVASGGGERIAILADSQRWTYAQLARQVDRIAHVLQTDLRLIPGNRVLLRGANTPMMAACLLAVLKAGCIAVPTMPLLRARELSTILAKAQVNAVLCAQPLRAELDSVSTCPPMLCFGADDGELEQRMAARDTAFAAFPAHDTAADDVCLISFTSGTTGVPKGTMHMHRDLLAICDCFPRSMLQVRADDIFIGTPPLAFTFGLGGLLLFPLRFGACAVLLEKCTPETLLRAIDAYQATICFTAPTFYRLMAPLATRHEVRSLRLSVSAGEALPLATRDAWQVATGLAMVDGIGATEMLHIFISATGEGIRRGAVGKAIPGYQACIVDDAGVPQPSGVTGRLAVKGPTGCRYLSDPRQREYVQNGWNLTGDNFEMDGDGYFYYRSRSDDMIVSAGYNIAGPEVEEALQCHPAVAECAVVGRADAERGQIVEAHVVLKDGCLASDALAAELQHFVRQQIAPYKYPRAIRFLSSLPRTETGKLQRFKLRTDTA